ncbi:hypothetical protein LUZ60_001949 [Juncus effusus]|nr:hypothetical protein LUZ60_001949 [Juncus effusus]
MGSMNNWLGFSLSPQDLSSSHTTHPINSLYVNTNEMISSANASSYGALETFNTSYNQSQDWSMKNSELSALIESSNNQPKLEDFLGAFSFSDGQYHEQECVNIPTNADFQTHNNNNSIGLSMIKSWLRTQPNQPSINPHNERNNSVDINGMKDDKSTSSQSVVLSMSTSSDGKRKIEQTGGEIESSAKKAVDHTFGQRTSIYRGVTKHRWTGRYEAHLWDNSCKREGQNRKGRQVYLGGYDKEDKAARSYDLAALKYWGPTTTTNFPVSNYEKELEDMKHMTRQEWVAALRRKSSGFSRGASIYRGVTRHHQHGRWQARIGRVAGNKDLYLGTFSTQEEAAEAYDIAAIKFRGLNAVTNFEMNRYDVKSILESTCLPVGSAAKRLKETTTVINGPIVSNDSCLTSSLADQIQIQSAGLYYPYGHVQMGSNYTQNFFQCMVPMEHSTGSNSIAFDGSYEEVKHNVDYVSVLAGKEAYERAINGGWAVVSGQEVASSVNNRNNICYNPEFKWDL